MKNIRNYSAEKYRTSSYHAVAPDIYQCADGFVTSLCFVVVVRYKAVEAYGLFALFCNSFDVDVCFHNSFIFSKNPLGRWGWFLNPDTKVVIYF